MIRLFFFLLAIAFCFGMAFGQITETKLTASDGAAYDYFGVSVSISGDYAIIGSSSDDDNGTNSGSAYVFRRDGANWVEEAKITASDGVTNDYFGASVSISGDDAIVGAHRNFVSGSDLGSAYIFTRDGINWTEEAKLTASDAAADDYFGVSVSISGNNAIIGASFDDDNGTNSGSAYVFKRDGINWTEEGKLTASDGAAGDHFGVSVSISGDYAIIGAHYDDDIGTSSGSAYIFRRDGANWVEEAKISASDGATDDHFGVSASISGDDAIVGAFRNDVNGSESGSAYIFKRDGVNWTEEAKLTASDGAPGDYFGASVSISGNNAIIGANYDDGKGSAYIFRQDGSNWVEEAKIAASDGTAYDQFGASVSISGDDAIVGAYEDDGFSGSAYEYSGFTGDLCADITSMVARCIGGDTKTVQVRVNLVNNTIHEGDSVTITIDGSPFTATIISNGTSSRANFSVPGWTAGDHVVSLVDPPGCLADVHPTCVASDGIAKADPVWDDDAELTLQNLPQAPKLIGNYPNPSNPSTTILYALSQDAHVRLVIYNMLGQLVATLVDEQQSPGHKSVIWDGKDALGASVASGIYIYRITTGGFTDSKRMLLIK